MGFLGTVVRRLAMLVLVVAGVAVITFSISHLIPGDPAQLIAGEHASAEALAHVRADLGLDRSLPEQFRIYVGNLLKGDLGTSLRTHRSVAGDIAQFLPATLELGLAALALAILAGVPLGVLSAIYKDGPVDQIARLVSVSGISMPVFWFGLALILVFYVYIPILPGSGRLALQMQAPPRVTGFLLIDTLVAGNWHAFLSALRHLILPAVVLAFANLGIITRQIRAAMLDVLNEDYVRTARANGLSRSSIILRHALPNALIPPSPCSDWPSVTFSTAPCLPRRSSPGPAWAPMSFRRSRRSTTRPSWGSRSSPRSAT